MSIIIVLKKDILFDQLTDCISRLGKDERQIKEICEKNKEIREKILLECKKEIKEISDEVLLESKKEIIRNYMDEKIIQKYCVQLEKSEELIKKKSYTVKKIKKEISSIYSELQICSNEKIKKDEYKKKDINKGVVFDLTTEKNKEDTCSICTLDYEVNEEILILHCNHMFHKSCISEWVLHKANCPCCRHNILTRRDDDGCVIN